MGGRNFQCKNSEVKGLTSEFKIWSLKRNELPIPHKLHFIGKRWEFAFPLMPWRIRKALWMMSSWVFLRLMRIIRVQGKFSKPYGETAAGSPENPAGVKIYFCVGRVERAVQGARFLSWQGYPHNEWSSACAGLFAFSENLCIYCSVRTIICRMAIAYPPLLHPVLCNGDSCVIFSILIFCFSLTVVRIFLI